MIIREDKKNKENEIYMIIIGILNILCSILCMILAGNVTLFKAGIVVLAFYSWLTGNLGLVSIFAALCTENYSMLLYIPIWLCYWGCEILNFLAIVVGGEGIILYSLM